MSEPEPISEFRRQLLEVLDERIRRSPMPVDELVIEIAETLGIVLSWVERPDLLVPCIQAAQKKIHEVAFAEFESRMTKEAAEKAAVKVTH